MHLKRSSTVKQCIAAYLGAALYCEWLVYIAQPLHWSNIKCQNEDSCVKILFIADPQLQGDKAVSPPLSYLFNWDSDRYLKSTFSVANSYFKPDVLVYLGDLMDEGSISTMEQFHHYAKRLFSIFELNRPVVQVWLPGDNDIGGENEPVKNDKVAEFEKIFAQPSVIDYHNISFYKVNGITRKFPKQAEGKGIFKIVVSHYPVTLRHYFGNQVNQEIHPEILFCAHDHESKFVSQNKEDLSNRLTNLFTDDSEPLTMSPSDDELYEIYVPPCSYRMGTSKIGYGAAVIDKRTFDLTYTVFWSPGRFPYLYLYLVLLATVVLYCVVYCVAKLFIRQTTKRTCDKVPLLERI